MPIFENRNAFVVQNKWLEVGRSIWQSVVFNIDKDHFPLLANGTLDGLKPIQASYHDQMIVSSTPYSILRRPTFLESMDGKSVDEQIFECGELLLDLAQVWFSVSQVVQAPLAPTGSLPGSTAPRHSCHCSK